MKYHWFGIRSFFVMVIAFFMLAAACTPGAPPAEVASTMPPESSPQGENPTQTAPAAVTSTTQPETSTPAPVQEADVPEIIYCPVSDTCSIQTAWQKSAGGYTRVDWPVEIGEAMALSPTGKLLYSSYFPSEGAGPGNVAASELKLYDLVSGEDTTLIMENVVEAVWVPGEESFVYVLATPDTYELRRYFLRDGVDTLLASDVAFTFSVSPDASTVAFARESGYEVEGEPGLYLVSLDGGDERRVSTADRSGAGSISDKPVWSRDNQLIWFPVNGPQGDEVHLIAVDGSFDNIVVPSPELEAVMKDKTLSGPVLWTEDNRRFVAQINPGMLSGEPVQTVLVTLDQNFETIQSLDVITFGTDITAGWQALDESLWMMTMEGELVAATLPAPGTKPAPPTPAFITCDACSNPAAWRQPRYENNEFELVPVQPLPGAQHVYDVSSTGIALAGSRFPDSGLGPANLSVTDLLLVDYNNGEIAPLIAEETIVRALLSPQADSFIYILATPDTYELHWQKLESGEDKTLAVDVPLMMNFSPDGSQVAFTRESGYNLSGDLGLYVVDIASGEERKISAVDRQGFGGPDDMPRWSPDGEWIIVPVNQPDTGDVLVRAAVNGPMDEAVIKIAPQVQDYFKDNDLANYFLWHPDGRHLIADLYKGMVSEDPQRVVMLTLNEDLIEISDVQVLFTGDAMLVGWNYEGYSMYTTTPDATLLSLLLPAQRKDW